MFKLPQDATKTMLAVHGWSGVLLGLLLYAVICTGVAAVFATEIDDWASPMSRGDTVAFGPGLDNALRHLAGAVDSQFHEEVAIWRGAGGRVNMLFHRHEIGPDGKSTERGVEFELDPATWEVLDRREGWYEDIEAQRTPSGIAAFLVDLHVRLHIPEPYGLIVTGVLGLAMMVAAVTGLVIHRHLLKDLFTLRVGRDPVLRRRDLHVVAGSWNLPFAFILAFTGSFFSFATTVGLPMVAAVKFDGDQEAVIETLYGTARAEDTRSASSAAIVPMLADVRARSGAEPNFVSVEHFGRADSTATIFTVLPRDRLVYTSHLYDGVTGEYLRERPPLGNEASLGAALVGLMYPLHFGHFAGTASKAVWVALGFAGAYVTFTGMLLWTRRRAEQPGWRAMTRAVYCVGYGLPLALVVAPYAFFVLRGHDIPPGTSQGVVFLAVVAIAAVATVGVASLDRLRSAFLAATGVALLGLPLVRMITGGPGWSEAWQAGIGTVLALDVALLVAGTACIGFSRAGVMPVATVPHAGPGGTPRVDSKASLQ
ncbi:MAG: PepSY domain-containing protein [Proteobacteria bacterium]|nr:MAG: PepSY domain-containing protein [Pseudomonadota bacterium]